MTRPSFYKIMIWSWIGIYGIALFSCRKKTQTETAVQDTKPRIDVAYPEVRHIVLHREYPGYLTSEQTVNLVGRVNGYLQEIRYKPGEVVEKGQLLFVIEPTLYRDAVVEAEATLNTAQSQLDYARNNYVRMKEAAEGNAISEIDLIQSQSNLAQAEAGVKQAQAQLATARTNLSYCYVKAPFRGRMSVNQYDIGAYINGGVEAAQLATLYNDANMYAYFDVEDNQYLKMVMLSSDTVVRKQLPEYVTVMFSDSLYKSYKGTLNYLAPNIELTTGTINLRAELENPEGDLRSGLYVTVSLPYGECDQAVLVNDASIGVDQLGKYIYALNDSNRVVYTPVETGELVDDTLRQVIKGLSGDERYVTKALLKVRNGMHVDPVLTGRRNR